MSDERITSLPVLSDLDGSEWLVVDDGSATYRTSSDTYARVVSTDTEVTVGTDGDYATVSEALEGISDRYPVHSTLGWTVTVRLLTGYVWAENVYIRALDLSWVDIVSDDATVTVDRSSLGSDPDGGHRTAFGGYEGAKLPKLGCKLDMDTSGTLSGTRLMGCRTGAWGMIDSTGGLSGGAERLWELAKDARGILAQGIIENGLGIGVRLSNGSNFYGANGTIKGCDDANFAMASGQAVLNDTDLQNAGSDAFRCTGNGDAQLIRANGSGAGRNAVRNLGVAHIDARGMIADDVAGDTFYQEGTGSIDAGKHGYPDTASLLRSGGHAVNAIGRGSVDVDSAALDNATNNAVNVSRGAVVNISRATGTDGKLSQVVNKATPDGLIFSESGPHPALPVVLPSPRGWTVNTGTPTHGLYTSPMSSARNRQAIMLPTDGNVHSVVAEVFVPDGTPSWALQAHWVNPTTNTGDVRILARVTDSPAVAQGDDFASEGSLSIILNETVTDPGQHIRQVVTGSAQTMTGIVPIELGSWTNSTLGADVALVFIEIVEA